MASSIGFDTQNVALAGTAVAVLFPETLTTVTIHAVGGDITMNTNANQIAAVITPITISNGVYFSISNRLLRNKTFYFNGTATLELLYELGDN